MTALAQGTDDRVEVSDLTAGVLPSGSAQAPEWAKLVTARPAITFKVYGVRVERTETAVHMVFGAFRRDPNRSGVCPCEYCVREARHHGRWSLC